MLVSSEEFPKNTLVKCPRNTTITSTYSHKTITSSYLIDNDDKNTYLLICILKLTRNLHLIYSRDFIVYHNLVSHVHFYNLLMF